VLAQPDLSLGRTPLTDAHTCVRTHLTLQIKWLDLMLLSRADQVQFEAEGRGGASNVSAAAVPAATSPAAAPDTWSSVFVDVELPVFPFPVLHEERRCVVALCGTASSAESGYLHTSLRLCLRYQQRAIEAASFGDLHEAVRSSARYPSPTVESPRR